MKLSHEVLLSMGATVVDGVTRASYNLGKFCIDTLRWQEPDGRDWLVRRPGLLTDYRKVGTVSDLLEAVWELGLGEGKRQLSRDLRELLDCAPVQHSHTDDWTDKRS